MNRASIASWAIAGLFALLIAGYPLAAVIPVLAGIENRLVSVPFRALFLLLALAVIAFLGIRRRTLYTGVFWVLLAIFWLLYGLRLLLDTVYVPAALRLSSVEYLLFSIGMTFIPMIAFMVGAGGATLERARKATLVGSVAACCIILGLAASRQLSGDAGMLWVGRIGIRTLNPIALGHLGASLVLLASYSLLRPKFAGRSVAGLILAVGIGLVTVTAAASRGPVLALGVTMVALLASTYRHGARVRAPLLGGIILTGGVLAAVALEQRFGISILYRLVSTIGAGPEWAPDIRVQLVSRAWEQFLSSPILGSGLEEQVSRYYPHNVIVESFMATGIAGGITFVLLILTSSYMAWRLLIRDSRHAWIALLYAQYLIGAQFSGALYTNGAMWALMGAVVARSRAFPQTKTVESGATLQGHAAATG